MKNKEVFEGYSSTKTNDAPKELSNIVPNFDVFKVEDFINKDGKQVPCNNRNFYKIILIIGKSIVNYADKVIHIEKQALLFVNPHIPYSWEQIDRVQTGYFCIFTKNFFYGYDNIDEYPLFRPDGNPVINIAQEKIDPFNEIFLKMFNEMSSEYIFKYNVLRNLILDLIHLSLKTQPIITGSLKNKSNATIRISSLFMDLLERQFPIESTFQQIAFRSPSEYANQLNIHVNHLNKAMKKATGKTTSQIISERIIQESKLLLQNTNWNVNEIGWCLNFEDLSSFINFFKKSTALSPTSYRATLLV